MKKYLFLLVFIVTVITCDNSKKPIIEEKKLIANKILSDKVFSPDFMIKINDKLVISSSLSDTMLYVYSLPLLKYLNNTGIKGNGPEDFQLFPVFCESSNNGVYIWGYDPITIKKFMEVYNYDGLLVKRFTFDISPQLFIVDEEYSTIYGYNNKHEDYLLHYKF